STPSSAPSDELRNPSTETKERTMSNFIMADPTTFRTPSYQRDTNPLRVDKIAEAFDLSSFGTVTVSRRKDGHLYIVDGKHRATAAVKNGLDGVPALVLDGLT